MKNRKRKYSLLHFLMDLALVVITGGIWLLVILFLHIRRSRAA